jgi:DNA-directed RNA polymerase sigma subunit (sigma70/sigma32)
MASTGLCKRCAASAPTSAFSAERVRQLEQQALDTLHAAATQAPTSS